MSRQKLASLSGVTNSNPTPSSPQPKRANQLTEQQRSRLFACICVARHIHGARSDHDDFNEDIYEETLALMQPHWRLLDFDHQPSYITCCKIWKDFVRTGLITAPKLKTKLGTKSVKFSSGDDDTRPQREFSSPLTKYGLWGLLILALLTPFILSIIGAEEPRVEKKSSYDYEMKLKTHIDDIKTRFPGALTPKQLRAVRARLEMMKREVSVLLLLVRSHDIDCKIDKTFCIGRTIANVSRYPQFGYVDVRDSRIDANDLVAELSEVLDERNDVMMIDSLDRLPGHDVMSLFQFIDRDEMNKRRRGLLLLVMYTGNNLDDTSFVSMREADIVERLLVPKWSQYVRGDTLTSVLSRISGTIVKVQ